MFLSPARPLQLVVRQPRLVGDSRYYIYFELRVGG